MRQLVGAIVAFGICGCGHEPLHGEGEPQLDISPRTHDFGNLDIGCAAEQDFVLTNIGADDLDIAAVTLGGDGTMRLDTSRLARRLPPSQATTVRTWFEPALRGRASATLTVRSNDADLTEQSASLVGVGTYANFSEEIFSGPGNSQVDILFAIDRSGSMGDDAQSLANNFSSFIDTLGAVTSDWRIGVVTEDSGCFNYGILDTSRPNYRDLFAQAVNQGGNAGGEGLTEALLAMANQALDAIGPSECNQGFVRPDATLQVILVTDERYHEGGYNGDCMCTLPAYARSWQTHVTNMQALKSDATDLHISGVINPAEPEGYREAIAATSGIELSIYDPWAQSVVALAEVAAAIASRFVLASTRVDPDSLSVWVDGELLQASDWVYDEATHAVTLNTPPGPNSTTRITYGELGQCDSPAQGGN